MKFTSAGSVVFSIDHTPGPATDRPILRFAVSDTGRGIAPEDAARLFEPFVPVGDRACASACGTGLGLAISRSLVERMGGRLKVESNPGTGSRFWFEVPLVVASAAVPVMTDRRSLIGYEGPRRRVLVVDDNVANRGVLVDLLTPLGFELAEAVDGTTALRTVKDFRPHLVLMDLRLPGDIDGPEATRILRRSPRGGDMRIVAVSASAMTAIGANASRRAAMTFSPSRFAKRNSGHSWSDCSASRGSRPGSRPNPRRFPLVRCIHRLRPKWRSSPSSPPRATSLDCGLAPRR